MGKGNGAYKIAPMWEQFEISPSEAQIGDMIIFRNTGQWDRIKTIYVGGDDWYQYDTKFGKTKISWLDVMLVRY